MSTLLIINPSVWLNCTLQAIRIFLLYENSVEMNTENIIIEFESRIGTNYQTMFHFQRTNLFSDLRFLCKTKKVSSGNIVRNI
jgi:hypothetical protein